MLILTNDYHNTTYSTRKTRQEIDLLLSTCPAQRTTAERQWIKRVHNRLCGSPACTCARNEIGERPAKS